MTKFYFHIRNDAVLIPNDEGIELASLDAALAEALSSIKDLVSAAPGNARASGTVVEIADARGRIFDCLPAHRVLH